MAKKKWIGLFKLAEECAEVIQELMKLNSYPEGVHPRRRRSVILTTEEEIADVEAILEYFKTRNKLNLDKIKRRKAYKLRKWVKRWGAMPPPQLKKPTKKQRKKQAKRQVSKKSPQVKTPGDDASSHVKSSQTT
jgi:hypothetical protein